MRSGVARGRNGGDERRRVVQMTAAQHDAQLRIGGLKLVHCQHLRESIVFVIVFVG
jgi:hypothetical protein